MDARLELLDRLQRLKQIQLLAEIVVAAKIRNFVFSEPTFCLAGFVTSANQSD